MKFSSLLPLAVFSGLVTSKNIFDLESLQQGLLDEETATNDKREPVNILHLDRFKMGVSGEEKDNAKSKRDPKNVIDLASLKVGSTEEEEEQKDKREPKNLFNLQALNEGLKDEETKNKREAKNLPNLDALEEALKGGGLPKKDAKNLIDLVALKQSLEKDAAKRDAKNIPNLQALRTGIEEEEDGSVAKRDAKNVINLNSFIETSSKREGKNLFDLTKFQQSGQQIKKRDQTILTQEKSLFVLDSVDCYNNLLQSILPQLSSISIFSSYIRQFASIDARTANPQEVILIVAPDNDSLETKLSDLKPWEFPELITPEQSEQEQDKTLKKNLLHFLNGHLINNFEENLVIDKSSAEAVTIISKLNNGKFLKIKQDQLSQKFSIRLLDSEDWIDVETIKQVENGFVLIINDSLVKP
ncbi:conserved hypothetical protein [Candida dubliniensis CD36]|uniref:FAS1 domain-containing protein n=1 Tax=Candida dubliniensis (strain CD36 / ATCC MYA-646 / CBS 7987 / NCPF 3949 / NRRL Y-17841) TaxID=573826 RepID=B9W793_CANDC|nr:conserved hypothetical protein [Candida dubliniensis CD36]CAX44552.1 conserved hypothetical protein [Candida dubliniensis CD36]